MEQEFTTLREMFSEVMEETGENWEGATVSRESWLDIPIPHSYGDVSLLYPPIDPRHVFVWTRNHVYFLDWNDDSYFVNYVPRGPESFRSSLKRK